MPLGARGCDQHRYRVVAMSQEIATDGPGGRIDQWLYSLVENVHVALPQPEAVEGVGRQFCGLLAFRQLSSYQAVAVLLVHGLHSEATALLRRQFEDPQRIAYLSAHQDWADALCWRHMATPWNLEKVRH